MMAQAELAKVENEVRILSALSHPHIITYHCSFQHDDKLHIVMEFASRGSVDNRVAEVARAMDNTPRLLRRWLPGSLLATASSTWPLAALFSKQ